MNKNRILVLVLILALCLVSFACSGGREALGSIPGSPLANKESIKVHFIDVGQADAILIQGPGNENIVIDAGNNSDSEAVVEYIKKQGVKELKAVIGTHPHEDHIGGLDAVIRSFKVEKVYLPKVTHTSDTFRDILKAVSDKSLKVTSAVMGVRLPLTSMEAGFVGPVGGEYDNLNDYSAVLKLTYGETGFLFQGDAERKSEQDIIESEMGSRLDSDVLKVGHHGSSSSTTKEYLEKVSPKYAIVMVGKDNDYGHPHKETMELLKSKGIIVYRTDVQGTIILESDGKNIKFNVDPIVDMSAAKSPDIMKLYTDAAGNGLIKGNINSKGEKIYHLPGGAYYDRTIPEKWFKSEFDAQEAGYRPSGK